jgi:hypothetical protein
VHRRGQTDLEERAISDQGATIGYSALFPDLDGVCRQIVWSYKWRFFRDADRIKSGVAD